MGGAPYNIGIATGPSGLVVIDLDTAQARRGAAAGWALPGITDGADVLAALCERARPAVPGETFTVRTGRGGLHLYFTAPPGAALRQHRGRARGLGWLIDTRAARRLRRRPRQLVDLPGRHRPL